RHWGETVWFRGLDSATVRPQPRTHDRPGRRKADQEGDEKQDRKLDVRLDIAPEIYGYIEPVTGREQRNQDRDQDPQEGLQELHAARIGEPCVECQPRRRSSRRRVVLSQAR